jgi:hypothetical protein
MSADDLSDKCSVCKMPPSFTCRKHFVEAQKKAERERDAAEQRALEAEAQAAVLRDLVLFQREVLDSHRVADVGWPKSWGVEFGDGKGTLDERTIDLLATDAGKLVAEVLRAADACEAHDSAGWDSEYNGGDLLLRLRAAVRARREAK